MNAVLTSWLRPSWTAAGICLSYLQLLSAWACGLGDTNARRSATESFIKLTMALAPVFEMKISNLREFVENYRHLDTRRVSGWFRTVLHKLSHRLPSIWVRTQYSI